LRSETLDRLRSQRDSRATVTANRECFVSAQLIGARNPILLYHTQNLGCRNGIKELLGIKIQLAGFKNHHQTYLNFTETKNVIALSRSRSGRYLVLARGQFS
jgi:hypothetical protein